ncbi:MAG: T9SS type A sorting domain-containing protein [Aureispira sp.]
MNNLFIFILIFFTQIAFGQTITETRTATLVDGDYTLDGTVYLELFDNGLLDLRFDTDYLTQSNVFDVHVFLTNNNNYADPIDTTGMLLVENIGTISGLNYSSGAMTFNLPSGVGINDYQHIVFVCVQFGRLHWGNGAFGNVVQTTLNVTEATNEDGIHIYPNPTRNGEINVQFQDILQNVLIEVYDVNGQIVSSDHFLQKEEHTIELEQPGAYFLRLTSDKVSLVKKIIRL